MTDSDYKDIFHTIRHRLRELGFGMIDESIISNMRGSDGAFWDLNHYLKELREQVRLGSDHKYRETMLRTNRYVETESGRPIEGIRVSLSEEERQRYDMPQLDILPSPEMDQIAQDLDKLMKELVLDYQQRRDIDRESGPGIDL
jgi:hypothetical protein